MFAVGLTQLLKQRGFKLKQNFPDDKITNFFVDAEDKNHILCAPYISEYIKTPKTDMDIYSNYSLIIRKAFGEINNDNAFYFCKNASKVKRIASVQDGEGSWKTVQDILKQLSKERIQKKECIEVLKKIRSHEHELRMIDALPDWWMRKGIPKQRVLKAIASFLEFFGFSAKCKKTSIEVECSWTDVETKDDKISEVAKLKADGLSIRAIAEKTGIARSTVSDWLKNECPKTTSYPQKSIYTSEANGGVSDTLDLPPQDTHKELNLEDITVGQWLDLQRTGEYEELEAIVRVQKMLTIPKISNVGEEIEKIWRKAQKLKHQ